jgi:hypothetical protein
MSLWCKNEKKKDGGFPKNGIDDSLINRSKLICPGYW